MPPSSVEPVRRKTTLTTLRALRQRATPAVCVTAYDYPTAVFAERAGIDVLLVGDSAAMTMLGLDTTVGIGMREMLIFTRAVCRGAPHAFVIGDLPFLSYQVSNAHAIRNAGAFVRAGCDAVKCEGGARVAGRVRAMTDAGIAVMGHIGLTPQSLGQLGGYRVQGRSRAAIDGLLRDAESLARAGAFGILVEAVPPETAELLRSSVDVLWYGIGAGPGLDGQLVISHDILGSFVGAIRPRFVRRYAELDHDITAAFRTYASDVRGARFPAAEHCYAASHPESASADPVLQSTSTSSQ